MRDREQRPCGKNCTPFLTGERDRYKSALERILNHPCTNAPAVFIAENALENKTDAPARRKE